MRKLFRTCVILFIAALISGLGLTTWKMFEFRERKNLFVEPDKWQAFCAHEKIDVVLFGDSQVALWPLSFFGAAPVAACGVSGSLATKSVERFTRDVLPLAPRRVIIEIGTNDIGHGVPDADILRAIETMIATAKANNIKPAVCSVLPVTGEFIKNHPADKISAINSGISLLCERIGVEFIDLHALLVDKNGMLKKSHTSDGLHLNLKGYVDVSKLIISLL